MNGAVLALFCAVALVSAELNENGCPINPYVDILKPHPNCNKFYQCFQGDLIERKCASDLVFNVETQECDWASEVDCTNRPIAPESSEESGNDSNSSSNEENGNSESNSSSNESGNDSGNNNTGGGNGNPGEAAAICAVEGSDGVLVAHENCDQFYKCFYGVPVAMRCNSNLLYNYETEQCDWAENVNCEGRNQGGNGDNDSNGGNGDADKDDGNNDNNNNGGGNGNPGEASEICALEGSDGVLVAHENCNQFYECSNGVPVARRCASYLLYNYETEQCDWAENVNCEGRNQGGNGDNDNNGGNGNGDGDKDDGNNDNNNNGGGNGNPKEAPEICAAEGSDGVLVAHENCNQFYECSNGVPVAMRCASNLLYDYETEQCDWAENVNCEGRNQGGNGDNDNNGGNGNGDGDKDDGNNDNNNNGGGNGNPKEAPEICAAEGSDGVLVAHENCNQFYECSNGVPVARRCASNLLYNYETEQCDWADNVNCEGRNQGDNGDNDNNGGNGNGDGDKDDGNNDNNNNGGGNGNPKEAPEICAAEGSDGVLVAHENCNQFYECSNGVPVARRCASYLLYNYETEQCDWAENVNCEGRNQGGNGDNDNNGGNGGGNGNPKEAPEICAAEGSDGVLVAHENCNQFYECSNGVPVARRCASNLLYNYETEQCDWAENVNCEGRNQGGNGDNDNNGGNGSGDGDKDDGNNDNNNNGGGNGNPKEAPEICAAEGSDGVLVAHENCNQFYTCSNGVPVARDCNLNLLYNYKTEQCDWPENVNCEGRDGKGDNGSDNNGSNGDEDSEDGDKDNGNVGGGGGNGNPSEVHEICAREDSDSVLVAHENCHQYYVCRDGLPVTLDCNPSLLFNPATDQCDWPDKVDCGDRRIFRSLNKHLRYRM